MKKQFLILSVAFLTVTIFSCNKEKTEMQPALQSNTEETLKNISSSPHVLDSTLVNLEGRFEFDGNLTDKMGKLTDGNPVTRTGVKYTTDRKGHRNKALLLDGTYGINIRNVPQQTHTSLSVWLNIPDRQNDGNSKGIVSGKGPFFTDAFMSQGFGSSHDIIGGIITGYDSAQNIPIGTITAAPFPSSGWHHYVITYDGNFFRYYFDGDDKFIKYQIFPANIASALQNYMLGFSDLQEAWSQGFWQGSLDDLRFYSRTISATDVQRLYHQ